MNGLPKSIFQFAVCFFLLHAIPSAQAQPVPLRFEMEGKLNMSCSAPNGQILTNYQGIFRLVQNVKSWSIATKNLSLGTADECVFDGQSLYSVSRHASITTNSAERTFPTPTDTPSRIDINVLRGDAATATISTGDQPLGAGPFSRAIWLGTVAGQSGVDRWKTPVILPWSTALPGGVQQFGARPEWSKGKLNSFPNKVDFRVVKESRETRIGNTIATLPEMQAFLPLGMKVGRLEILTWTNVGNATIPASWIVTRISSGDSKIQEHYLVQGNIVSLDPAQITVPKPAPITSVSELRIKFDNITIPVSYNLTNQNWLPIDDPLLITQASQKEASYLEEMNLFSRNNSKANASKQSPSTSSTPLATK
jgi:hypothetical protein